METRLIRCPSCGVTNRVPPNRVEAGRVRFAKLNVDETPQTAARFKARSIPILLVLKAGREVDRLVGVQPRSELVRRLERVTG